MLPHVLLGQVFGCLEPYDVCHGPRRVCRLWHTARACWSRVRLERRVISVADPAAVRTLCVGVSVRDVTLRQFSALCFNADTICIDQGVNNHWPRFVPLAQLRRLEGSPADIMALTPSWAAGLLEVSMSFTELQNEHGYDCLSRLPNLEVLDIDRDVDWTGYVGMWVPASEEAEQVWVALFNKVVVFRVPKLTVAERLLPRLHNPKLRKAVVCVGLLTGEHVLGTFLRQHEHVDMTCRLDLGDFALPRTVPLIAQAVHLDRQLTERLSECTVLSLRLDVWPETAVLQRCKVDTLLILQVAPCDSLVLEPNLLVRTLSVTVGRQGAVWLMDMFPLVTRWVVDQGTWRCYSTRDKNRARELLSPHF